MDTTEIALNTLDIIVGIGGPAATVARDAAAVIRGYQAGTGGWAYARPSQAVVAAPVAEAPVAEAPVAEAPVAEAPVAEAPVADTPVA